MNTNDDEVAGMYGTIRWTEDQLMRDIEGLDRMISRGMIPGDPGSRSAIAYLKQLRRDRQEALERLRVRRRLPQAHH